MGPIPRDLSFSWKMLKSLVLRCGRVIFFNFLFFRDFPFFSSAFAHHKTRVLWLSSSILLIFGEFLSRNEWGNHFALPCLWVSNVIFSNCHYCASRNQGGNHIALP